MGTEFVASHIWRNVDSWRLTSRHPLLNSFVPNLVWLPSQISKLTDREGGVVQQALQTLSWSIYRNAPVAPHLVNVVESAWRLIPEPALPGTTVPPLNWFVATDEFKKTRHQRMGSVVEALEALAEGKDLTKKVVASRFTDGLPAVSESARNELARFLAQFVG